MRPASEIHYALEIVSAELGRESQNDAARRNLSIARDVLAWVAGEHWADIANGDNPWLVAFLLDDPPKIDDTPPEAN